MLAVRRGRQVIMSSSHKWRPRPPTLFLSLVFSLTKPDVSTITTVSKLVLQTLALVSNLNPPLLSLNNIRSSDVAFHLLLWLYGKDISPPPPVSHGPYGGVDRSEKEHRDSVALKFFFFFFLLDMIFTVARKSFTSGYFHFFFFFPFLLGQRSSYHASWLMQKCQGGKKMTSCPFSNVDVHRAAVTADAFRRVKWTQSEDLSAFTCPVPFDQTLVGRDGEESRQRMKRERWKARRTRG